jgi:catechol 2,3-dioxygenase-like lactoylglutathione lyase family enzyme
MPVPVGGLDHIAITVSDTQRSLDFYCGLLGLRQVEQHALAGEDIDKANGIKAGRAQSTRLAAPDTPGILIDLLEYFELSKDSAVAQLGRVGSTHFCLSVTDLPAFSDELGEKGVEFISEPVNFKLEHGSVTVVFLRDPDGNFVELVEQYH